MPLLAEKTGSNVLTVPEAAHILRVNRNTAYEAIRRGQLPAVRLGRRLVVPRAALEPLVADGGPSRHWTGS